MNTYELFQVDAFAKGPFTGNPAAIVPLQEWIPTELMQNIALENNLSETAFIVPKDDDYEIRWFTPLVEVDLCGHATLASAYVIFQMIDTDRTSIVFHSRSGPLYVTKSENKIIMDFPTDKLTDLNPDPSLIEAIGAKPVSAFRGSHDLVLVYENYKIIENMRPNFNALASFDVRGVLTTAPGFDDYDFVSRGFFPTTGINEDPATGSAHTTLTPYWSQRLSKNHMNALQMSSRGGYLEVENKGERTILKGQAHLYLQGKIFV